MTGQPPITNQRAIQPSRKPARTWSAALAHTIDGPVIAIVTGVSGSGKTTVAALLAAALGCHFQEGDYLHRAARPAARRNPL